MSLWDREDDDGRLVDAEPERDVIDACENCGREARMVRGRCVCTLCERREGARVWDLGDV